ncbi:TPA: CRISPR-associated helicase Cas3' [Legionella pneumophila]|nr:CRISPR-associated helicase Cas3' [Legionella pneumophila]
MKSKLNNCQVNLVNKNEIAHVKKDENGQWKLHLLDEHLRSVASLASKNARIFGGSDWAFLAGLWHDLGKYRPAFQNYIKGVTGFDPEAHIEQGRVDHSTAGAVYANKRLGKIGCLLSYLIAGHHAGLPDWIFVDKEAKSTLEYRLNRGHVYLEEVLAQTIPDDILEYKIPETKPLGGVEGLHLWMRMLFSCLVDADFLDTELFMSPDKATQRAAWPDLETLKSYFDNYMQTKILAKAAKTPVNEIRASILDMCREAASMTPGIFSLTVPTGGGKTLASMAFALEHALKHHKRRVIVVIPYTSIIEQTADQYRKIFNDAVIEHHSNIDPEQETAKSRLASENWDAPIIVTTNVQLLESLFAARTSKCRKLHNLVNSVIVIDEVQLLPPEFLQPVLDVFRFLTMHYGVTLVLSTATQPALNTVKNAFGHIVFRGLEGVREIVRDVPVLYQKLSRAKIEKPTNLNKPVSWENLAEEICQHQSVLVIVNTRKDCRALFDLMPEGTIHLSGLMCGEHRSVAIQEIKHLLREDRPVRVVSTQLVEAGVDLDFPIVYRALSGLDSIAQAAGRCNREGKLKQGQVIVFVPPNPSPMGMLRQAEQATISIWHDWDGDPLDHRLYQRYFEQYFNVDKDKKQICSLLTKDADHLCVQFRTAAERFRIIDDAGIQILVPYNEKAEILLRTLRQNGPERWLMRQFQRYTVTIYEQDLCKLRDVGAIEEIYPGIYALSSSNVYSPQTGLLSVVDIMSACNVF